MGRLTRDPEIRYRSGESAIARYTLAVDRRIKRDCESNTDFIGCVAFGKSAEFAEKYLRQGTKIAIVGRIQTGSYTKRDGQKVFTTDVFVDEQEFAESKSAYSHHSTTGITDNPTASGYLSDPISSSGRPSATPMSGYEPTPMPSGMEDGFMNIPDGIDEELTFK